MDMEITKTFEVKLTPDDVKKILSAYLRETKGLNVNKVSYDINITYDGPHDSYGSNELTSISCSGYL